jgi:hypothetical protein
MTEEVKTTVEEPIEPDRNWALFDKQWTYRGGIVSKTKPTKEDNPEGYTIIEVERFPQFYEHWDPNAETWIADTQKRVTAERKVRLEHASRPEFAEMIRQEVQELVLNVLPEIVPGLQLTEAQIKRLFPLARRK